MRQRLTGTALVAYLRDSPSSEAGRWAADEIEQLTKQSAGRLDIVAHQAKLNESANAQIRTLREALQGLLNALPSATTHPAIQAARAALGDSDD